MRLAARIARLERDVQRTCPHCQDWPEEVTLVVREILITSRDDAKAAADLLQEPGPWSTCCPYCGRPPPEVSEIIGAE
jgi:hypothetical protein